MTTHFQRMLERYLSGEIPWDNPLPPPEVLNYVPTLKPGRALDLGCGPGRASIFMAQLGWEVDGVDFIPEAIAMARQRAAEAGVSPRFHVGSVTDLHFLTGPYDLVLDVGCLHGLPEEDLPLYHREVSRLLRPGGQFLLFAHLRAENPPPDERPRWLDETRMRRYFDRNFTLQRVEYGTTQVGDNPPWKSAWYWFVKNR
ncbi:MAG: class I SAM-dependent methyltransferase [Caldilineae bacterium]|nr:MAG: class I SAM-dependent methyltransferase [Caldilineae bacterium]